MCAYFGEEGGRRPEAGGQAWKIRGERCQRMGLSRAKSDSWQIEKGGKLSGVEEKLATSSGQVKTAKPCRVAKGNKRTGSPAFHKNFAESP